MAPDRTTPSSARRIETADLVAELQSLDHPPYVEQVFTEALHTLALYNFHHVRERAPTMARFRSRGAGSAFRQIGRIVTMPAGVPMEVRGDGGRVDAVRCQFTPALLSQISGRDHFATRGDLDACTDVRGPAARLLLESLGRELAAPGFAAAAYADAIGHALIVELARHLQGAARPRRVGAGLSPAQMATLTDYIHAAPRAPSLADVGALLGYSSRHVNRSFRRSTGQTLHSYIEDVRFQRACALLAGEDLLIKEVAWRLGFSCASNFAVAFRRRAGVSPQAYARLHGRAGIVAH